MCISSNPLKSGSPFDINNHNEWKISSLRKYLNEEYILKFNKDDLEPLDGDLITLLSKEDVKKYKDILPEYSTCWWTRSADVSSAYSPWLVDPWGRLHSAFALYATGIVPVCAFNLNNLSILQEGNDIIFESKN